MYAFNEGRTVLSITYVKRMPPKNQRKRPVHLIPLV